MRLNLYEIILLCFSFFCRVKHYAIFFFKYILFKIPYCFLMHRKSGSTDWLQSIQNATKNFSKIPKHVSLVFVEDNICIPDLAFVILWCVALGVSVISVCDSKGILSSIKSSIKKEYEVNKKYLKSTGFIVDKSISLIDEITDTKVTDRDVAVYLISPNSGKQMIVQVAKTLSHSNEILDTKFVDNQISNYSGLSDPELVIKFGFTDCLTAFCPWQIRSSELLSLPTHHYITVDQLYSVFGHYARTEQRWGK